MYVTATGAGEALVAGAADVVAAGAAVVSCWGAFPKIAPRTNKTPKTAKVIVSHFGNRFFGRG
ncbi:hypothetical protein [Amycolatopsis sp. NBC_00438]|uniref:hypothetical protein n=1 Tax=Amycolatopsis sp. NBC_00438 TaxID=2903558 RepID=UPI002E242953